MWSKCLALQIKTFLFEYLFYVNNPNMFSTYQWFWFEILESFAVSSKSCRVANLAFLRSNL